MDKLRSLDRSLPITAGSTVVRLLRTSDLEQFMAYRSDARLARFQGWSPPSEAEAREFLAEAAAAEELCPGDWVQLGIASAQSDGLMGDLGVFLEKDLSEAELGFTVSRAAQGQGHARRAAGIVSELVFRDTPVAQIRAVTDLRNMACVRMLEGAGFAKEREHEAVFKGEACREAVYIVRRGGT